MWMVGEGEGEPFRAKQWHADKLNNLLQQGGGEKVDLWVSWKSEKKLFTDSMLKILPHGQYEAPSIKLTSLKEILKM